MSNLFISGYIAKNVAITGIGVYLQNRTTGAAITSGTVTVYHTPDGGAQGTIAGTPVHEGNGQWTFDLTQAEMNYDVVALLVTHADSEPINATLVTSADLASALADTNELQTDWTDGGRLDNILDARSSQSTQDTIDTNVDSIVAKLPSKSYLSGSGDADGGVDSTEANVIADALLTRDWTAVTGEASRSALNALRALRNKWSIAATTLTVTEEDDSTTAWTSALTTDSGADPVTASDPA